MLSRPQWDECRPGTVSLRGLESEGVQIDTDGSAGVDTDRSVGTDTDGSTGVCTDGGLYRRVHLGRHRNRDLRTGVHLREYRERSTLRSEQEVGTKVRERGVPP